MAGRNRSGWGPALQVSRGRLETARKRYHLRRDIHAGTPSDEYLGADQDDPDNAPEIWEEAFGDFMMEADTGLANQEPAHILGNDESTGGANGGQGEVGSGINAPADDVEDDQLLALSPELSEQEDNFQPMPPQDWVATSNNNLDVEGNNSDDEGSEFDEAASNDSEIAFIDDVGNFSDDSASSMGSDEFDAAGLLFNPITLDPSTNAANAPNVPNVPSIARWRLNLTALSQRYNLYFVAYMDLIHVSRPRSCTTNDLPSKPDLVLKPAQSLGARHIQGSIDPFRPHQVNHLIVGDFGNEEILLMAYDDGDVIGYRTREIDDEVTSSKVKRQSPRLNENIKPFFHENVRKSAWGLAIHTKSRLIAVGSNLHCATVFAPALSNIPAEARVYTDEFYQTIRKPTDGRATEYPDGLGDCDFFITQLLRQRTVNWRIILDTTGEGDNIPNLTFSNDKKGDAEKVVAVDVQGNIWLMDIWTFDIPFEKIPGIHRSLDGQLPGDQMRPRGWGVLVLQESSFLPAQDCVGTFGLSEDQVRQVEDQEAGLWLDISKGITKIPQNALRHPRSITGRARPTPDELRQRRKDHGRLVKEFNRKLDLSWWFNSYPSRDSRWDASKSYVPDTPLDDGSSILRLYERDIELRPHRFGHRGIVMQHAITQMSEGSSGSMDFQWEHNRLSNNHYIPELSLVVAGSMSGRVALITLTKSEGPWVLVDRAFKVECILPLSGEDHRIRPLCNLFGVAVGPLPVDGRPDAAKPSVPRRYRIMLQYYDQTILSYEISRGAESDVLAIN